MKAQELRIGNWYNVFSIPKQADALLILKLQQIEVAGKTAIDVSPIPLTEEWLLKWGFASPTGVNSKDYGYIKGYYISLEDGVWVIEIGGSLDADRNKHIKLPYVHTLQNLYYALTGEEL